MPTTLAERQRWYNAQKERGVFNEASAVRARRHRDMLDRIKVEMGCTDCGYDIAACALDFDHLPGYKKRANVAAMATYSWYRIVEELEKCEVVCANCHRIRTKGRLCPS